MKMPLPWQPESSLQMQVLCFLDLLLGYKCHNYEERNRTEGRYKSYKRIALKLFSKADILGLGFQTHCKNFAKV